MENKNKPRLRDLFFRQQKTDVFRHPFLLSKRQDLNLRSPLRSGRPRSRGPLDLVGPLRPEPVPGRILKRSQMSRSGQKWRKNQHFSGASLF